MPALPARLRAVFRLGPGRPEAAPISLRQGRIYLLPTLPGLAFAGVLAIMLVASINYGISLGYAFAFLLGGIGIASVLCAFRNLLRITIRYGKAESAFPGGNVVFHLLIENPDPRRRPALRLFDTGKRGETSFDLPPNTCVETLLALPAQRRGVLPIGRTVIETRWPLGLVRAWSVLVPDMEALVFPKPEVGSPPPVRPPGDRPADLGSLCPGNEDFAGLRAYRDTDSPRRVAWKVYARDGVMMTKEFSASASGELLFNWDDLPTGLPEEARLSRLATWLLRAGQAEERYALRLPACEFPSARGEAHLRRCLGALARHGTEREKRWE
ncbi:MAG: DUF58 domain-containing protein [Proteobacteria bacterium]|jgi:uncharacterized protein (DUF58 family)|nr:DUF58 domain-containing protein [Pseudomonadota bacterium]